MSDVLPFTQTPDADAARTVSVVDPVPLNGGRSPSLTRSLPTLAGPYELGEEIAHGGMGVVYRATDTTFGREVAVKVLHEKYGLASDVMRRFTDEAWITGQLQHPAIPPVHDRGTLPDGRPFLAMKLIRGRSLDQLLAERPDPAHDRGRFVAVFEKICEAVAYAHAHKVLHRDLKPANIMVGNYGEVQVMDWGLAKVLDAQPGPTADPGATSGGTAIHSLRDSDGVSTQAGSVLGTPAFMPPEQALAATGKIDPRSDVFGLGAILAVILTGKPPFASGSTETTRIQAAQGNVEECFARLDACGADPELVGLCKRCLAPQQEQRPANAGEVAWAVADLRAAADERARQAELERVKAAGEKVAAALQAAEQRKRRWVQLALAAAIGVLLLGVGVVAWWQERQAGARRAEAESRERDERERRVRNAEAVATLLDQSEEVLRAEDSGKAAVILGAAEKRAAEGGAEELAGRLDGLRGRPGGVAGPGGNRPVSLDPGEEQVTGCEGGVGPLPGGAGAVRGQSGGSPRGRGGRSGEGVGAARSAGGGSGLRAHGGAVGASAGSLAGARLGRVPGRDPGRGASRRWGEGGGTGGSASSVRAAAGVRGCPGRERGRSGGAAAGVAGGGGAVAVGGPDAADDAGRYLPHQPA